jgi:hypothetical protein
MLLKASRWSQRDLGLNFCHVIVLQLSKELSAPSPREFIGSGLKEKKFEVDAIETREILGKRERRKDWERTGVLANV